jgi:hypothetical protein
VLPKGLLCFNMPWIAWSNLRMTAQTMTLSIDMITLKQSEKQLDDLYEEILSNANLRARMKCLLVYLRAKGRPCHELADITRVDGDTVTHAVKKYSQGGLAGLLKGRSARSSAKLQTPMRAPAASSLRC